MSAPLLIFVALFIVLICVVMLFFAPDESGKMHLRVPLLFPMYRTFDAHAAPTLDNPLGMLSPEAVPTDYFLGFNLPESGFIGVNWSWYDNGGVIDLAKPRRFPRFRLAVRVMFEIRT